MSDGTFGVTADERPLDLDVAEAGCGSPDRRGTQLEPQPAEGEHRLAVRVGQHEVVCVESERERIEVDRADRRRAAVVARHEREQLRANQTRNGQKTRGRVRQSQHGHDADENEPVTGLVGHGRCRRFVARRSVSDRPTCGTRPCVRRGPRRRREYAARESCSPLPERRARSPRCRRSRIASSAPAPCPRE